MLSSCTGYSFSVFSMFSCMIVNGHINSLLYLLSIYEINFHAVEYELKTIFHIEILKKLCYGMYIIHLYSSFCLAVPLNHYLGENDSMHFEVFP